MTGSYYHCQPVKRQWNKLFFGAEMKRTLTADAWCDHAGSPGFTFQQDGPKPTRRASRRTACKRTLLGPLSRISDPKLSRFEPNGLSRLGRHAGKVPQTQQKHETMSWKSLGRPSGKYCQEHTNMAVANFTKHLTACVAINGPGVTSSVCIKSPFPSLYPHLSIKNILATHILEKTTSEMLKTSN